MNPALRGPHGPAIGELLGPWRILELIDSGTYGSVYRVSLADRPEADEYALKLAHHAEDEREAELLRRIRHPHVPRYHDHGFWLSPQGKRYPYVVMQRVEGTPLYSWARSRKPTQRQVCRLLAEMAGALAAIHEHGTHRDVKGDNVLVDRGGRAVLVDLGMCSYPEARPLTDAPIPPGTEPYRSPQLLRFRYHFRRFSGARYTYCPEDDLYALGVTAYRLVTGTYPPPATDPECADDPERPPPGRLLPPGELASVSPELEELILRLLSEKLEARGTASEVAQAFQEAAKSMGRAADVPIRLDASVIPTERTTRPGPRERPEVPGWISWAAAAMAVGLAIAIILALPADQEWRPAEPSSPAAEATQEPEVRVPETVGVADAGVDDGVLSTAVGIPPAGIPNMALASPLPKTPAPGQKKPPCDPRSEHLILGACWTRIDVKPPCGASGYEYDGKCVLPSVPTQRSPTSDPP